MEDTQHPQHPHGVHPVVDAIAAIDTALDRVADAPVWGLGDDDLTASLAGCERVTGRQAELCARLVAEADGRDLGRRSGAASTRAWLRERLRWRPGQAKWQLDAANRMAAAHDAAGPIDYAPNIAGPRSGREMRATRVALAEGAISADAAVVIARTMAKLPEHVTAEQGQQAEADLAGFARDYDPGTLAKLAAHLLHVLDIDTLDDDENDQHRRRDLRLNEATGRISGRLDNEGMAAVRTVLDILAKPQPGSDGTPDPRTPGQRLADALVELARRALASDTYGNNHGISHRVLVLTGLDTLTADHHCDHHGEHPTDSDDSAGDHDSHGDHGDDHGDHDDADAWVDGNDHSDDHSGDGDDSDGDDDSECGNSDNDVDPDTDGPDTDGPDTGRTEPLDIGAASDDAASKGAPGHRAAGDGGAGMAGGQLGPAFQAGSTGNASGCPLQARAAAGAIPPGELAWGGPVSAAAVRRLTCFGSIQRIVLNPAGAVLDVGREYRTVTPAQYAALIARDGVRVRPQVWGWVRPDVTVGVRRVV